MNLKLKDTDAVLNKSFTFNFAKTRGELKPIVELVFKPNGYLKTGSKVYVDLATCESLINNLTKAIDYYKCAYDPYSYYESKKASS